MSAAGENRLVRTAVILAIASIAMLPMAFYGCGPEWARWDAAQANMYFRRGETEDALYQLRDAIRKSPRDPVLRITLAERLIEIGQLTEAVMLCNEVLDVYPGNEGAMRTKASAQQHGGDFRAALQTQLEIDGNRQAYLRGASSMNELAYFRALARTDLHLAKEDIESAIKAVNREFTWPGSEKLDLGLKATVAAVLVARCCDSHEEAMRVTTKQIEALRKRIDSSAKKLTEHVHNEAQDTFPVDGDKETLLRRQILNVYESRAAVLLTCRAFLYQDLGDRNRCNADRLEVKRLGLDSSEIAKGFPDEIEAIRIIEYSSALLDTRGYICSLLPWRKDVNQLDTDQTRFNSSYAEALRDMDVAILCSEVNRNTFDCFLRNKVELNQDRDEARKILKRQSAVLLYHRMTLHQRAGQEELASLDAKQIEALGEVPGPSLF